MENTSIEKMLLLKMAEEAKLILTQQPNLTYSSDCPACDGTNKLILWPCATRYKSPGAFWCSNCGVKGDAVVFARKFLESSSMDAVRRVTAWSAKHPELVALAAQLLSTNKEHKLVQSTAWVEQATQFVKLTADRIKSEPAVLKLLQSRGIPAEAVEKYMIGFSDGLAKQQKMAWGLQVEAGTKPEMWLPRGIVMPDVDTSGRVIRIKIERSDWQENSKFPQGLPVKGSMSGPSILDAGDAPFKSVMVIVESKLDSYAISHAIDDSIVAASTAPYNGKADPRIAEIANQMGSLYILHTDDVAGADVFRQWQELCPHAKSCPIPRSKSFGDAIAAGLDAKAWLGTMLG